MQRKGFTLIELLLTVAIVGIVSVIMIPLYRRYQVRNDLNNTANQVMQILSRAQMLSRIGELNSEWGFHVQSGTLYKGESYATRDDVFDETYPMPTTIAVSGLMEVHYSRLGGVPSQTGSIVLLGLDGEERTVDVIIPGAGVTLVMPDRLSICHCTGGGNNTLNIPDNAWPAHRNHGDRLGPCEMLQNPCP